MTVQLASITDVHCGVQSEREALTRELHHERLCVCAGFA
jgi:hypothetical protein